MLISQRLKELQLEANNISNLPITAQSQYIFFELNLDSTQQINQNFYSEIIGGKQNLISNITTSPYYLPQQVITWISQFQDIAGKISTELNEIKIAYEKTVSLNSIYGDLA
ncbi:MAG: hypothetical protein PHH82_02715 [Candidatus ainarchaeum sp.]|nr:hypothetical protein [Candidatus ainarchaeum sp.]